MWLAIQFIDKSHQKKISNFAKCRFDCVTIVVLFTCLLAILDLKIKERRYCETENIRNDMFMLMCFVDVAFGSF
ncbi:MAG: hypothetical protein LBL77_02995 [Endomicrobium sp.]|nr:hypothetical protein [Endomicrobium sp.]